MQMYGWPLRIGTALTALTLTLAGCAGPGDEPAAAPGDVGQVVAPSQPAAAPEPSALDRSPEAGAAPGSTASPRATAGAGRRPRQRPTSKPSKKPRSKPVKRPTGDRPPPVKRPKPTPGCSEKFVGKPITRAKVKAALTAAAGRTYWPVSAPDLSIPLPLVKAVAWQESTWRSNVRACDGGIGLMQVMPDTAAYLNQRFEKSYDVETPADNATLGVNYLAWLTKYFGDVYFEGSYDLTAADCRGTTDLCLLNMVISGYNYGFGAVDDAYDNDKPLPNPAYVKSVRKLLTSCECASY